MNKQAYITGFVKRANEYGYSAKQALQLLKQAAVNDNAHTLNINSKPLIVPTAPKPVIKKDPMRLPASDAYGSKPNIPPAPAPEHVPNNYLANHQPPSEQEIQELADVPLSNMTPKDHWTQGLHDILAKRPATQLRSIFINTPVKDMPNTENMQQWQHTSNLNNAMYEARNPGMHNRFYPLPKDVQIDDPRIASMEHIQELANHIDKYDPGWGDSFRIPIATKPPIEGLESLSNLRDKFSQQDKDNINEIFKKYVADKAMNSQNNNLTNNVNIPTGL